MDHPYIARVYGVGAPDIGHLHPSALRDDRAGVSRRAARAIGAWASGDLTVAQQALGTPACMSPEQAGGSADIQAATSSNWTGH
jgi:hypothetical protein